MENLFVKGIFFAHRQGMRRNHYNQSLIKINNVTTAEEAKYYLGKAVAFVNPKSNRVVYGRITKLHGNNGVVQAQFTRNLSSLFLGHPVRVMLYPQSE